MRRTSATTTRVPAALSLDFGGPVPVEPLRARILTTQKTESIREEREGARRADSPSRPLCVPSRKKSSALWLQHDLDAPVALFVEDLVAVGGLFERQLVSDHEAGVDLAVLHALDER